MRYDDIVVIYKRYVEPFIAIFVLIGLLYSCVMLYQNYQAKQDIALECGWTDEDVRCTCERSKVIAAENRMRDEFGEVNLNVSLG